VFDTMLATGVLLVPIGIVLLGIGMRRAPAFGPRFAMFTIALGTVGIIGAVIAVIEPGSMAAAGSVLAITLFHLSIGWRTLTLGNDATIDLTDMGLAPTDQPSPSESASEIPHKEQHQ
jgi:hypothetical protein